MPFAGMTRSLYLGSLPEGCSIRDICDVVRGDRGLESVRLLPAKSCAFVDFLTRVGAERFVARCRRQRLQIAGQDARVGWAKEKLMSPSVSKAIENGATRNVYINFAVLGEAFTAAYNRFHSNSAVPLESVFNNSTSESSSPNEITNLDHPLLSFLYSIFDEFGPIDMIKVVPARRIGFVHMAAVGDAMRAVAELSAKPEFSQKKLSFGRDRCGERVDSSGSVSNMSSNATQYNPYTAYSPYAAYPPPYSTQLQQPQQSQFVSRTVYLGGCGAEITIEDLCDQIHTGQLQSVRLNPEKKCAFLTFIKLESAEMFLARAMQFGLVVRGQQLKPAFAREKNSSSNEALPVAIVSALRKGVTRCLFLGNVDFNSFLGEQELRQEMSAFGPLDRVQILKERGVAFVHFANLLDASRAHDALKNDYNYRACRVGFGRDRCEPLSQPVSAMPAWYPSAGYYPPPLLYDPTSRCYLPASTTTLNQQEEKDSNTEE